MKDSVATAPTPVSALITLAPTENQGDCPAGPNCQVAGSIATMEKVCAGRSAIVSRWKSAAWLAAEMANNASDMASFISALRGKKLFGDFAEYSGQTFQLIQRHALVHLVDAGIDRPHFDDLRAHRRDESRIRGAAAGVLVRHHAAAIDHHLAHDLAEFSFAGQERLAAAMPPDVELQSVALEHGLHFGLEFRRAPSRIEPEIEHHLAGAWDNVVRAGAGMDVGN